MRLPRLFATPAKPTEPQPQTAPRGSSGRWHTSGYLQFEELNAELQHPQGHAIYDRMWRTDPDVRRSLAMALNPILGATWSMEPHGGDDATDQDRMVAEAARWALWEYMQPGLSGHLAEALPLVSRSGFAPFEQVWRPVEYQGRTLLAPRRLLVRLPRSVTRWFQDDLEELTAIEQQTLQRGLVTLDAANLTYYRVGSEGDNWEGVSMLRPAYKPWYLKDKLERIDAIAQELEGTGLPVVYPPMNAASLDGVLDDLEERLASIRAGETAYLMMPGPHAQDLSPEDASRGWRFDIAGRSQRSGSSGRDASGSLGYHSDKIAAALISEFMRLGQSGVGARATADVQQDPFLAAVEGFASTVIEPVLNQLVNRFAQINFAGIEGPPILSMSLVDSTSLEELANYVANLVLQGALHPDDVLEDYLRDRADLPAADPKARAQRQEADQAQQDTSQRSAEAAATSAENAATATDTATDTGTGAGTKTSTDTKTAHRFGRQSRPLRHWEQHMSLDTIEEAIDSARARFQDAGADHARTAAADVARQVAAGKKPKGTPPDELASALEGVLTDLYSLGRQTVSDELERQGAPAHAQGYARKGGAVNWLARRAAAAAREVMAAIVRASDRADLQGVDEAGVQRAAETAAAGALRAEATIHAAPALNQGRSDEADDRSDEIAGSRYTSILDGNRCDPCAKADDDVLRPLTDPVRLANKPPNRDCAGGDRCRCIEFFQLEEEAPPSA